MDMSLNQTERYVRAREGTAKAWNRIADVLEAYLQHLQHPLHVVGPQPKVEDEVERKPDSSLLPVVIERRTLRGQDAPLPWRVLRTDLGKPYPILAEHPIREDAIHWAIEHGYEVESVLIINENWIVRVRQGDTDARS